MATKRIEKLTADNSVEETTEKAQPVKNILTVDKVETKRKFEKTDAIPCKSITNGKLIEDGDKSGIVYRWNDYGDIEEVEYQDLLYFVRAKRSCVFKPRIIIMDTDFIEQNSALKSLYDSLYSTQDLREILNLSAPEMKKAINNLPDGAKDAIKGIAATMIDSGQLDSVRKIKIIDEIFDTQLLLALAEG